MIRLSMETNIREYSRALDDLGRSQMPFVAAQTMNDLAFGARGKLVEATKRALTIRRARVLKGYRVKKATKRAPVADLGSLDWYMRDQVLGGIRRPRRAKALAVPTEALRPSKSASIGRAKRPGALLAKAGPRAPFILNTRKGEVIARRKGRKGKTQVEILYGFEPQVRIVGRVDMGGIAAREAATQTRKIYGRQMRRAIATTRRRFPKAAA